MPGLASSAAKDRTLLPLPVLGVLAGIVAGLLLLAAGVLHVILRGLAGGRSTFNHFGLFFSLTMSGLAVAGLLVGVFWTRLRPRVRWYLRWTLGGVLATSLIAAVAAGQPWQWAVTSWGITAGVGPLLGLAAGYELEP